GWRGPRARVGPPGWRPRVPPACGSDEPSARQSPARAHEPADVARRCASPCATIQEEAAESGTLFTPACHVLPHAGRGRAGRGVIAARRVRSHLAPGRHPALPERRPAVVARTAASGAVTCFCGALKPDWVRGTFLLVTRGLRQITGRVDATLYFTEWNAPARHVTYSLHQRIDLVK